MIRGRTAGRCWAAFILVGFHPGLMARTSAATFHVSPRGDDTKDGGSPATAWRTVARVNAHGFEPGDEIHFERGGEWRESLVASSSGTTDHPIVYAGYGTGPRPKFWGSDLVDSTRFEPGVDGTFQATMPAEIHAVLVDHVFLRSARLITKHPVPAINRTHVATHPGSWFAEGGVLTINTGGDPRRDSRPITVVVREDVVASNGKDHLVFRDLVVDESARFDGGYGFRIMGSTDVRVESCVVLRAGKHHFGVINSTGFVGVNLTASVAMPDQGPGGASAFVTYSDSSRHGDTSVYVGCVAEPLDDAGTGGRYPAFVTHGAGVGSIVLDNFTSHGGEIALGNHESGASIRVRGGRLEDASLRIDGRQITVDGLTIVGKQANLILEGTGNTVQNVLMTGMNPGFAGYQAAITEGGQDNRIRCCTIVMDPVAPDFNAALSLKRPGGRLTCVGNVFLTSGTVVRAWFPHFNPTGLTASANWYGPNARFDTRWDGAGALLSLKGWQALGLDRDSHTGDPGFTDPAHGDNSPRPGSPLIDALPRDRLGVDGVPTDLRGQPRPQGPALDIGAFEAAPR